MLFRIIILIFMLVRVESEPVSNKDDNKESVEQAKLAEFFGKYCKETDEKILAKLKKCEEIQPQNMKQIESECVKKVLKKSGNPSYNDIKMVECSKELGPKFDECETEKVNNIKMTEEEQAKLGQIAKTIMFCGFDCYGIKHD